LVFKKAKTPVLLVTLYCNL